LNRVTKPVSSSDIDVVEPEPETEKPKFRTDNLSSLNKEQRKFAGRIFAIIRDVLDPTTAENLILKIEEELK
jgi:hypothetical protein